MIILIADRFIDVPGGNNNDNNVANNEIMRRSVVLYRCMMFTYVTTNARILLINSTLPSDARRSGACQPRIFVELILHVA